MIKNAPKRIYLQVGDIPTDDIDFKDLHEVSWCEDKINDNDLCYIRAGKCYTPAVSKSKRLEHQVQLAMTGLEIISKSGDGASSEFASAVLDDIANCC